LLSDQSPFPNLPPTPWPPLPPAGYIRVKVEPAEATVDYIRTIMPQNENETRKNGQSFHQFKIR
jgi:hypothetical protein